MDSTGMMGKALKFYTTKEVAYLCHVTIPAVRKWIHQRKLRAKVKPGTPGYFLIADTDLLDFELNYFLSKYEWRKLLRLKKAARERAIVTSTTAKATTKTTASSTGTIKKRTDGS